jgi:glycerol-3-phosphate responsive antiterminator
MTDSILEGTVESVTIQIEIPLSARSLLESEEEIQQALNEAGTLATGTYVEALSQHLPIVSGGHRNG